MRNKFALFMSKQMVDKNLTLREVSRRSGIGVRNLSKIERGKMYPPEGEVLEKLAIALELNDSQTDEMKSLAEIINNKSVNELIYAKWFNIGPMLIYYIDDHDDISDIDKQKLMKMIIDENTFREENKKTKRLNIYKINDHEWVCAHTVKEGIEVYCKSYNMPISWYKELEDEDITILRDYIKPMKDEELKLLNFTGFDESQISWYKLLQFIINPGYWTWNEEINKTVEQEQTGYSWTDCSISTYDTSDFY